MISQRFRGGPAMALASFFFACMAAVARVHSTHINAAQFVVARFVVGLLVVAVLFRATGARLSLNRPFLWIVRGVCGGGSAYFYFQSIEHLGAGPATLLNYVGPICGAVFGIFFLKEKMRPRLMLGILTALSGSALVVLGAGAEHGALSRGVWEGLLAAVFSGASISSIRALRSDTSALAIFFSLCLFGLVWAVPFAVLNWKPLTWSDAAPALAVGLLSTAAQLLMTYAFKYLNASSGGAWTQLTPAFAWVIGVTFLAEPLSVTGALGVALCIGGVLWGTGALDALIPESFSVRAPSQNDNSLRPDG